MKSKAASSEIESNGMLCMEWMVDDEVILYGVKFNFYIKHIF